MKNRCALLSFTSLSVLFAAGCNFVLEPIEQRFLFRPWGGDPARLALVAAPGNGIEEVKLPTADGVTLHGWLKRPKTARPGERFPLVIVFGGARRETSWMIDRTDNPDHWGWLFINYRGFGLSEGDPSERVVLEDSRLIYDYAASRADVDPDENRRSRPQPGHLFHGCTGQQPQPCAAPSSPLPSTASRRSAWNAIPGCRSGSCSTDGTMPRCWRRKSRSPRCSCSPGTTM